MLFGSRSEFGDWLDWVPVYLAKQFESVPTEERYPLWLRQELEAANRLSFVAWASPTQQAQRYLDKRDAHLATGNQVILRHYERLAAEALRPYSEVECRRPDKMSPAVRHVSACRHSTREWLLSEAREGRKHAPGTKPPEMSDATVVLVPCRCVSEIPVRLMFCEDYDVRPAIHAAMTRWLNELVGARLMTVAVQRLELELEIPKQERTWESWVKIASHISLYAHAVNNDFLSVDMLASSLESSSVWRFLWTQ